MRKKAGTEHDFTVVARRVVEQAIGERLDGKTLESHPLPVKNINAVALGRLGGEKGGHARAKSLSAKERKRIAKKAAKARWSNKRV
jgi:hypothetical protein